MTAPLLDRIKARKPRQEPVPIADRMPPFARRLLLKQLPPKDTTRDLWLHDGCGPEGRSA